MSSTSIAERHFVAAVGSVREAPPAALLSLTSPL